MRSKGLTTVLDTAPATPPAARCLSVSTLNFCFQNSSVSIPAAASSFGFEVAVPGDEGVVGSALPPLTYWFKSCCMLWWTVRSSEGTSSMERTSNRLMKSAKESIGSVPFLSDEVNNVKVLAVTWQGCIGWTAIEKEGKLLVIGHAFLVSVPVSPCPPDADASAAWTLATLFEFHKALVSTSGFSLASSLSVCIRASEQSSPRQPMGPSTLLRTWAVNPWHLLDHPCWDPTRSRLIWWSVTGD